MTCFFVRDIRFLCGDIVLGTGIHSLYSYPFT